MLHLTYLFIGTAFWIIGIYNASKYECEYSHAKERFVIYNKSVLWFIGYYGDKFIKNEFWRKPFYACPPCMASVHGTFWYWVLAHSNYQQIETWVLWVLFVGALSGFLRLITAKFDI
jgi:hypothetical protein